MQYIMYVVTESDSVTRIMRIIKRMTHNAPLYVYDVSNEEQMMRVNTMGCVLDFIHPEDLPYFWF